jgi:hypothetical protein
VGGQVLKQDRPLVGAGERDPPVCATIGGLCAVLKTDRLCVALKTDLLMKIVLC